MTIIRVLAALAAGLAAVNGVLLAIEGDVIAQEWLIAVTVASAFLSTVVASLLRQSSLDR